MYLKIQRAKSLLGTESRTYLPILKKPQKADFKDNGYYGNLL